MPSRACLVSFIDEHGIRHTTEVSASSLFEAAAVGVGCFRQSGLSPRPTATLTVTLKAPAVARHGAGPGEAGDVAREKRQDATGASAQGQIEASQWPRKVLRENFLSSVTNLYVDDVNDLLRSHDELRGALIIAGKRIRQLQFGRRSDPALTLLRKTLRDARVVRKTFGRANMSGTQT